MQENVLRYSKHDKDTKRGNEIATHQIGRQQPDALGM